MYSNVFYIVNIDFFQSSPKQPPQKIELVAYKNELS